MFHPTASGALAKNFYAVRTGMVDFFVYAGTDGVLVFDTGMGRLWARMGMRRIGLDPAAVTHVFLTHSDYDHVGGVGAFPKAALYLPAGEVGMIDGTTPRILWRHNKLSRPYRVIHDGEIVKAGGATVRAIATPGHTPGSMAYLLNGAILIAGDTAGLWLGRAHPFIIGMDRKGQRESLRKLAALDGVALFCTAHGGCTPEVRKALAGWE